MLELYYKLAKKADMLGLSHEVDKIDREMVRMSQAQPQVVPAGLTPEQYIQDIYRKITSLASQIQQIQLQQSQASPVRKPMPSLMEQTGVQMDTQAGNPANTSLNLNGQSHNFEIEQ